MNYQKTKTACYLGYVTHAVAVNLAPLLFACFQRTYEVKLGFLAFLTFITFTVQIFVDLSAVKFIEKVSFRALAVTSQYLCAIGLVLLGILPDMIMPEIAFLIASAFYSVGSGMAEVVLSPLIEAIPEEGKGSSLSLLHSFYSWGHVLVILVTTLLLRLTGDELWFVIPVIWSSIPLSCAVKFSRVPIPDMICHEEGKSINGLFKCKLFVLFFVMMISAGALEQIMAQWSSYYAEVALSVPKTMGDLIGPFIFAVAMAVGRTYYGVFGSRVELNRALVILSVLTALCFISVSLAELPIVSLCSMGVSGIGISLLWPGVLSLAKEKYKGGGASMFAFLAFGGDIGCSLGPFMCGSISDMIESSNSLRIGILSGVLFSLIMITGLILIIKRKKVS
ncbi:MAG: MFS transporter [Clostridia bacterium]|nr:MFS transporter [Clostridia bacterium]